MPSCPPPYRLLPLIAATVLLLLTGELLAGVPEIPAPRWMNPVLVADNMIINGLFSRVHHFTVDRPADDVLQFYRSKWQTAGGGGADKGYHEAKAEFWHVISRLEDQRYLLTVQVKGTGTFTSSGYLAVGDLKKTEKKREPGQDVPRMQGSKVVNDLISVDPGKRGRTLLVMNTYSIRSNSDFYRKYYTNRHWAPLIDLQQNGGHVLAFRKYGREAHLVISKNFGTTQIVINQIEAMKD